MATAQDLNLSLFKNESTICTGINNCSSLNRLSVALRYYSHLKVKKDEDDREIFASFVNEVYEEMVDDSNHLMLCHRDQMQQIADLFGLKCENMKSCQFTSRHFDEVMKIEHRKRIKSPMINISISSFHSSIRFIFTLRIASKQVFDSRQVSKRKKKKKT